MRAIELRNRARRIGRCRAASFPIRYRRRGRTARTHRHALTNTQRPRGFFAAASTRPRTNRHSSQSSGVVAISVRAFAISPSSASVKACRGATRASRSQRSGFPALSHHRNDRAQRLGGFAPLAEARLRDEQFAVAGDGDAGGRARIGVRGWKARPGRLHATRIVHPGASGKIVPETGFPALAILHRPDSGDRALAFPHCRPARPHRSTSLPG